MNEPIECPFVDGARTYWKNLVVPCCWIQTDRSTNPPKTLNDYENNHWIKSLKTNLKNGIKDDRCWKCWKNEKAGSYSLRKEGLKFKESKKIDNKPFSFLDLKLGNKCNLLCRMCDSHSSSSIDNELKNNLHLNWDISLDKYYVHDYDVYENEKLYEEIKSHVDEIKTIKFTGGEPTLIKKVHELIGWLVENNYSKNIHIYLTTNNTNKSMKLYDDMKKFKSAQINVSVDGTDDYYNYIRYPFTWDKFKKNLDNLKLYKSENFNVCLQTAVSVLNIMNVKDLEKWANQENIDIDFDHVYHPHWYNVLNLPKKSKKNIIKYLENADEKVIESKLLNKIVESFDENNQESLKALINDTQLKDGLRNQDGQFIFDKLDIEYQKT